MERFIVKVQKFADKLVKQQILMLAAKLNMTSTYMIEKLRTTPQQFRGYEIGIIIKYAEELGYKLDIEGFLNGD